MLKKKDYSGTFRQILKNTIASESLFNRTADLQPGALSKRCSGKDAFLKILQIFLEQHFYRKCLGESYRSFIQEKSFLLC